MSARFGPGCGPGSIDAITMTSFKALRCVCFRMMECKHLLLSGSCVDTLDSDSDTSIGGIQYYIYAIALRYWRSRCWGVVVDFTHQAYICFCSC